MKRIGMLLAVMTLTLPALHAQKPISQEERDFLVNNLKETRAAFFKSIEGLTPAQWTFKAGPDRWSIAECAEHIIKSETTIFGIEQGQIGKSPMPADAHFDKEHDQKVLALVLDRSQKAQAPEVLKPSAGIATPAEAAAAFKKSRAATIAYVTDTKDDLRAFGSPHPLLKNLDSYEWLLLLSAHSSRHTAQIEEVKASPGYPSSK